MRESVLVLAAVAAIVPFGVRAQTDHGSHGATGTPAVEAYREALDRMHGAMAVDPTGDPDIDFARGMIAHHQGAIDMARVLLEHGQDPALRELAEAIIEAQEAEIAFLEAWLADHGG